MSSNASAATGRHTLHYRVRNRDEGGERAVEVHASPEQVRGLVDIR